MQLPFSIKKYFSYIWTTLFYHLSKFFWMSERREYAIRESFYRTYRKVFKNGVRDMQNSNDKTSDENIIKICSWNIHRGFDTKRNYRLYDAVNYFKHQEFDIICLQESNNDIHTIDDIEINNSLFLAKALNYNVYYKHDLTILSKYPIGEERSYTERLLKNSFGNHRITVKATINNKVVTFSNYHLNNDIFGYEQNYCINDGMFNNMILEHNQQKIPLVICGDFNSVGWFSGIGKIREMLGYDKNNSKLKRDPTYPSSYPILKLDEIYTNSRLIEYRLEILETYVDYCNRLSDHHPLISIIRLNEPIQDNK